MIHSIYVGDAANISRYYRKILSVAQDIVNVPNPIRDINVIDSGAMKSGPQYSLRIRLSDLKDALTSEERYNYSRIIVSSSELETLASALAICDWSGQDRDREMSQAMGEVRRQLQTHGITVQS